MTFFVPRSNIIKPLMRTIGKGALRWTIISGVSGRSHLFVKWKDLAIMCSCAFSESGNAFVFSSKMTKGLLNYVCSFARQSHHSQGPLAGLDRKGLRSSQFKQSCDSGNVIGVFFHSLKPWASWGVLGNMTMVVGVVVLESNAVSILHAKICWGEEAGPSFSLTSWWSSCWPCGLWL